MDNLSEYKNIYCYNYGLGSKNYKKKIQLRGVQTTTMASHIDEYDEIILIKDIAKENNLKIKKIDLMHINIEGGEYELLDRMIESNMIKDINNITIQFHEWYPSYKESGPLRKSLHDRLNKTHKLTFCYPFIWENWKIM